MTRRVLLSVALLLSSCSDAGREESAGGSKSGQGLSNPSLEFAAKYEPELLGTQLELRLINRGEEAVCFEDSDLLPGHGATIIRNLEGEILNGSTNQALDELRGVNISSPIVAVRPQRPRVRHLDLRPYLSSNDVVIADITLNTFVCRELFDGGVQPITRLPVHKTFRIHRRGIIETSS